MYIIILFIYLFFFRYESTIVGQFFGHIHLDSYEMFYDADNLKRPVSMAYIGSSVTPYLANIAVNPSFRIYEIDGNYTSSSWVSIFAFNWYTFICNQIGNWFFIILRKDIILL